MVRCRCEEFAHSLWTCDAAPVHNCGDVRVACGSASQRVGKGAIATIHREFAEHLYKKGDYAGAAEQYVYTVGELPPSTVIASFLAAQRVCELTSSLQALHRDSASCVGSRITEAADRR